MATKKRKRTSDTDQSDRPPRATNTAILAEQESGIGTDTVAHSKQKEGELFQQPVSTSATRKRGRPRKDPTERPSKKPKSTSQRKPANSSSTTSPSVPSARAPSESTQRDLRRSKRNTRSSAHPTIAPRAPSPQVEPTPHNPSSLQHYKYFSQVGETQASSARTQARSLLSSQSSSSSSFRVTGEVPDSETEPEDETDDPSASFRSATQTISSQSDSFGHLALESTTIDTSPVASPLSPSFSIPETEPEVESSPAGQITVEEPILEHESEAQLHESSSQEIPDTFDTGGTLSTVAKPSGNSVKHSAQTETANASQSLVKESTSQAWSELEEQLRTLPQSTPTVQELEISPQIPERAVNSIDAALEDVSQSTTREIEPFAQERSQSVHRSSIEEIPPQEPPSPSSKQLQAAPQSPLEDSLIREIPSTTQTLRTPSQLYGRQQSQTDSEEQTTLLDSSIQTLLLSQTREGHLQPEEPSANQVSTQSNEQPEALSKEVHSAQLLSFPRFDASPLTYSRNTLRDYVAPVDQVNNSQSSSTSSARQDTAKNTHANGDHSHLAGLAQLPSQRQHGQSVPYDPVLNLQQQDQRVAKKLHERTSDTADCLSRHDSSQESPAQSCEGSSPVLQPPKQSLGTSSLSGNLPRRPETLTDSFLNTIMDINEHSPSPRREVPQATPGTSSAAENLPVNEPPTGSSGLTALPVLEPTSEPMSWKAKFDASRAKLHTKLGQDNRNFRRHETRRSEVRESESREPGSRAQSEAGEKIRGLHELAAPETGTRSPSTIPDRLPVSREPTSLRAMATPIPAANSIPALVPPPRSPVTQSQEEATAEPEAAPEAAPSPIGEDVDMGEASYSGDEEDESLLMDDVELQEHEYIVPLPMQGIQVDTYRHSSAPLDDLYISQAHHDQDARLKIEEKLKELRSIETHVDLVRIANSTPQPNDDQLVQDKYLARWSYKVSIKFRFLEALLSRLEARDLHVILLIGDPNNVRLFTILESVLRGINFSFESPSTGQSFSAVTEPNKERKRVKVTILASTNSQVLREAHLIVCLDGKSNVAKIRKKPWALKPDRSSVPFLQMVIPRTVGHIERYLSTKLEPKRRLDTIITTLSQFITQGSMGSVTDTTPPETYADEIVRFLLPSQDESSLAAWPLPSLGTIKDDIEYQTQQSQDAPNTTAPLSSSSTAGKRPLIHNDDRDDSAKRMRFTPQPQTSISHISDSEPATSLSIEQQLEWYKKENKRLREVTQSYVNRQWQYEEMSHKYKTMENRAERAENERDLGKERELKLREQLNIKTADSLEQRKNVEELRDVNLLSDDAKVRTIAEQNSEIERLRDELAKETKVKEDAIASKKSTETTLEYVQDQRREAQNAASAATQRVDELEKINAKLERAAKAKALLSNFNEQHKRRDEQALALVTAERDNLKKQFHVQAEKLKTQAAELERFKMTRGVGGGTRAASVGAGARTPRPGSRAASPLPNGRDRIANLRNG